MSVIDTLITDRTQTDVDRVAELKAKYPDWTDAEKAEWFAGMKGAYNAKDLNRIGEACELLYEKVYNLGYRPRTYTTPKTDWVGGETPDIPQKSQLNALLEDIRALKEIANITTALPASFDEMTFDRANVIERVLKEIDEADIPYNDSVVIYIVPSQLGTLVYNGNELTPVWSDYNSNELSISGVTSGVNAATYTAIFAPQDGYVWEDGTVDERFVTWTIDRAKISTVPTQSNTLTYNGNTLSPTWANYDTTKLVIGGDTSAENAGSYTATFTPTSNYQWSNNTTKAKSATWTIGRATIATIPSQRGNVVYSGNEQTATWNDYDPAELIIGGDYSGTNAGSYDATFTPRDNYMWSNGSTSARTVTWLIDKASISTIPSQSGTLTYTGDTLTPKWNNYSSSQLEIGGETSGTNAGDYTATFRPTQNYMWADESITAKNVVWTVNKAVASKPTLSKTTISINTTNTSDTVTVTRDGNGTIRATSSDTTVATTSVNGNVVTISAPSSAYGNATITITVDEGTNYTSYSDTDVTVSAVVAFPNIITYSWAQLSQFAKAGTASSYIKIGDIKELTVNYTTYYAQVIGFDHDIPDDTSSYGRSTCGITFQLGVANDTSKFGVYYTQTSDNNINGIPLSTSDAEPYMISVRKQTASSSGSIGITVSKTFSLSEIEYRGTRSETYPGEGTQYELYEKLNGVCYRYRDGYRVYWWLRSESKKSNEGHYRANGATIYAEGVGGTCYTAPCFCL